MKRILTLLLAAALGHAHAADAALDATACQPGFASLPPGAVQQASARLAAARSEPGKQKLALADALAGLALLSARQNGAPDIATDGNPSAAALLREALAIWNAARPSPLLALRLRVHGLALFNSRQCPLGREVLEAALRVSSAAAGADASASVEIAHDLLRIGLAQRDETLVRRLAPTARAALDGRFMPLGARDAETILALVDFLYGQPGDSRQDLREAEQLALRVLALSVSGKGAPTQRELGYRLAGIYYAQLRYAEAEALRVQLARGRPDPLSLQDPFARRRNELVALVRQGELQAALGMARALVEERRRAVTQAEAANPSPAPARRNAEAARLALAHGYLAEILHATGQLDEAAAAYGAALAGYAEGRGVGWEDRTRTRSGLAILYRTRGEHARALALQQQVLDELLPLVGEQHPDVQEARAELALLGKRP